MNRSQFLQSIGLSPNKIFFTYTCSAERVFPDEPDFIELLHGIATSQDRTLVIRLHPTERTAQYRQRFAGRPGLLIDEPNAFFAASTSGMLQDVHPQEAVLKFVGLMKYSEIVFNLASTITLDANLFLTPVICIGFNVNPSVGSEWNAAVKWYNSSHFAPIASSGAVSIVRSAEELLTAIRAIQADPSQRLEKRKALRDRFSPYAGQTKERVAEILMREISI